MFVPKDEQSSAVFGIGADGHRKTEQVIAKMYDGARATKLAGAVAGPKFSSLERRFRGSNFSEPSGDSTFASVSCPTRRCRRTDASVATRPLASAAERQYRWADRRGS